MARANVTPPLMNAILLDIHRYVDLSGNLQEQVERNLRGIVEMKTKERKDFASRAHNNVKEHHNYENRMTLFLEFYNEIVSSRENTESKGRFGMQKMLVLWGASFPGEEQNAFTMMLEEMRLTYDITHLHLHSMDVRDDTWWSPYDIVLVVDIFFGSADALLRKEENEWPRKWTTGRQTQQIRMIYHTHPPPKDLTKEIVNKYDVIFTTNSYDEEEFAALCTRLDAGTWVQKAYGVGVVEVLGGGDAEVEKFIVDESVGTVIFEKVIIVEKAEEAARHGEATYFVLGEEGINTKQIKYLREFELMLLLPRAKQIILKTSSIDASYIVHVLGFMEVVLNEIIEDEFAGETRLGVTRAEYIRGDRGGLQEFGDAFALGITRALCIGKARAAVKLDLNSREIEEGKPIQIGVTTSEFLVGRDGCWCLWADEVLVQCINFEGISIAATFVGRAKDVKLRVTLLGNIYQDQVKGSTATDQATIKVLKKREEIAGSCQAEGSCQVEEEEGGGLGGKGEEEWINSTFVIAMEIEIKQKSI